MLEVICVTLWNGTQILYSFVALNFSRNGRLLLDSAWCDIVRQGRIFYNNRQLFDRCLEMGYESFSNSHLLYLHCLIRRKPRIWWQGGQHIRGDDYCSNLVCTVARLHPIMVGKQPPKRTRLHPCGCSSPIHAALFEWQATDWSDWPGRRSEHLFNGHDGNFAGELLCCCVSNFLHIQPLPFEWKNHRCRRYSYYRYLQLWPVLLFIFCPAHFLNSIYLLIIQRPSFDIYHI